MKFAKLMVAATALISTVGLGVAADAKDHRHRHDSRYERSHSSWNRGYRSDRGYDRRDRDHRYDRDRRGYARNGSYGDVARRNYEYERNLQTCYRDGHRVC